MPITTDFINLPIVEPTGGNPLPMFRDNRKYKGAFRILPYTMKDRYDRDKQNRQVSIVVMENEFLRAEFLPEYGGRLYSLFDKKLKKELLFKNPVIQPANLSVRNAWFPGGIEWNITQFDHPLSSFDKVFFGKVEAQEGYEFLRMYDYERTKGIVWQIDFHLPSGSNQLYAHTVIFNHHNFPLPMCWWTNMALQETEGCRVFSGTKQALYSAPGSQIDSPMHSFENEPVAEMKIIPGTDTSYPSHFQTPFTYFLQDSEKERAPWGALTYPEGNGFFERSTSALKTRKVFCWGTGSVSQNWRDFLTEPGKGNYMELHSGLAPSTQYGVIMEEGSTLSFTQAFGTFQLAQGDANDTSYDVSHAIVRAVLNSILSADEMEAREKQFSSVSTIPCSKILSFGYGWGALENTRRMVENLPLLSQHLTFPPESFTDEQYDWLALFSNKPIRELKGDRVPKSWIADMNYLPFLQNYIIEHPDSNTAKLYAGVILYENDFHQEAIDLWKSAGTNSPLPIIQRNLAYTSSVMGFTLEALTYMEGINWQAYPNIDSSFLEEYFSLLLEDKQYKRMFQHYQYLPRLKRENENLRILACEAAIELKEFIFLENTLSADYATIHYSDSRLIDIWRRYMELKELEIDTIPETLDYHIE